MPDEIKKINTRLNNVEHKMDKLQDSFDNHFNELKNGSRLKRTERTAIYMALIAAVVKIIETVAPHIL